MAVDAALMTVGGVDTLMIRTLFQRKCAVHAEAEKNMVIVPTYGL